ncbi:hypothetical protein SMACR_09248 [Sordaria macrospora]|uniref:WGS project CABT00000000 data, contig 2.79 n=2 Tax=Sordaria macrospora TaxID=5147 RepID=F7WBM2_SORMK|nr:uncharacterized protein SMAC_09248 [Sordaria macrospora k-hell]KAA8630237.1 hypothetical protein SMACR_09248 [Sordaria macrospora]WPJ59628.1 hypothetical protein SMAC4_09248 [Sordaria macrospora]CCC14451.1 unnamed protein product [Sordaria macrospora k-hell]
MQRFLLLPNHFSGSCLSANQQPFSHFLIQTCDSCTLNATVLKKAEDPFDFYIFNSDVFIVKDEVLNTSALHINLTRKPDTGLQGDMEHQSCFLYPAMVNYSPSLDLDGFFQFQNSSWKSDTAVSLLNLNQIDIFETISTNLYQSASLARFTGNPGRWTMNNVGFLSNIYFATDPGFQSSEEPEHLMYTDPMDNLINSFRDLALRMSVREAQEKNDGKLSTELVVAQNVSYVSNTTRAEYATDEDALALGVVVSLIGPVATLVLFWGFWRLGRKVTMSPLEVINAMSVSPATGAQNGTEVAGIFADSKGNVEGAAVADYVRSKETAGSGEPKLQYGVVEETGRLGMVVVNGVLPERRGVRRPMKGEVL